jgi:hypothetical protein
MKFTLKVLLAAAVSLLACIAFNIVISTGILHSNAVTKQQGGRNVMYIRPPTRTFFSIIYHGPTPLNALGDKDGIDYQVEGNPDGKWGGGA